MSAILTRVRRQRGFNLLEVLIALAILSVGLLGVAGLQIQGVRFNHQSYSRSQAVMIANDYIERMYANVPGIMAGNYAPFDSDGMNCATPPAAVCSVQHGTTTPAACSAAEMATFDRFIVGCGFPTAGGRYGGVADLLPQGRVQVTCLNAAGVVIDPCLIGSRHSVTVSWMERTVAQDGTFNDTTATVNLLVQP